MDPSDQPTREPTAKPAAGPVTRALDAIENIVADEAPAPPSGAPGKEATGRAGRNLRAAIGVGAGMGAAVLVTLFTYKPAFVGVVLVAICYGLYELVRALGTASRKLPLAPMVAGAVAILVLTYARGAEGLVVAFLLTVAAVAIWRLAGGADGYLRDVASSTFAVTYVPFLAGFAVLMLRADDGPMRVVAFIATVVCSDVGGYAAGVLFGAHPMAPTVSPKKSWEGFAGSATACVISGIAFLTLGLHGSWWQGAAYGACIVASATLGDLGESMIKRDLGIKDMGTLLPGHGGLMDRLDSLLPSAPVAALLLAALVPPT